MCCITYPGIFHSTEIICACPFYCCKTHLHRRAINEVLERITVVYVCAARTGSKGSSWVVFPFYQLVGFQQGCWAHFCSLHCKGKAAHRREQCQCLGDFSSVQVFKFKRVSLILFVIPSVVFLVRTELPGFDGSP